MYVLRTPYTLYTCTSSPGSSTQGPRSPTACIQITWLRLEARHDSRYSDIVPLHNIVISYLYTLDCVEVWYHYTLTCEDGMNYRTQNAEVMRGHGHLTLIIHPLPIIGRGYILFFNSKKINNVKWLCERSTSVVKYVANSPNKFLLQVLVRHIATRGDNTCISPSRRGRWSHCVQEGLCCFVRLKTAWRRRGTVFLESKVLNKL